MPCQQCENGKWKWGETGECQYDSQAECEAEHPERLEEAKAEIAEAKAAIGYLTTMGI